MFYNDYNNIFDDLTFSPGGRGREIIEKYILEDINQLQEAQKFSYVQFEKLFLRPLPNKAEWVRYDHGIISAVKYLVEHIKLGETFLDWPPNRHAAVAMALHNFRYKNCDLRLSSTNPNTIIAYLLIVCDEIQEWERERNDADDELPEKLVSGRNVKKATDLVGVTFRNKYAFIILNHKLKNSDQKSKSIFEKYLGEKIALQKKHYPIKVFIPKIQEVQEGMHEEIVENVGHSFKFEFSKVLQSSLLEVKPSAVYQIDLSTPRLKRLRKILETETTKNLLIPSNPDPIYEVYVDHRIDGKPYLTIAFPF